MTTKATRDVLDMAVREINDFVLNGTGTASIDATPIGVTTPDVGFFTNLEATNLTVTGSADFTGSTIVGLQAFYADLAENYESDKEYAPGTVVRIGGEKEITETSKELDSDVFGVISTTPAFVMNNPFEERVGIWLAVTLAGRVPCKVVGPVFKGQRMVAVAGGLARGAETPDEGLTFARSLVDDTEEGERLIEVTFVTVR